MLYIHFFNDCVKGVRRSGLSYALLNLIRSWRRRLACACCHGEARADARAINYFVCI